jgi:hypothetical protein
MTPAFQSAITKYAVKHGNMGYLEELSGAVLDKHESGNYPQNA